MNRKLINLFKKKMTATRDEQIKLHEKIDKYSEQEQDKAYYQAEVELNNKWFREMIMAGA